MELDRQLHLADVDKELHDACSTNGGTINVTSLHSYPIRMWHKGAQASVAVSNNTLPCGSPCIPREKMLYSINPRAP